MTKEKSKTGIKGSSMSKLSPMMRQYLELKEQNPDCLLFFRCGDFYEMFFEDAVTTSDALQLTLTGKECGLDERAPMCGVPHHALDMYLARLVEQGFKVAVCEQMENPSEAKGLVKRDIIRVVTPGTLGSDEKENRYIMAIYEEDGSFSVAYADISTGEFCVENADDLRDVSNISARISARELVAEEGYNIPNISRLPDTISRIPSKQFEKTTAYEVLFRNFHFHDTSMVGLEEYDLRAAGGLMYYLEQTQKHALRHMSSIIPVKKADSMILDRFTIRNLELTASLATGKKRSSLLGVLDNTHTAMGSRMLRHWIEKPLQDISQINLRLDAVEELKNDYSLQCEISVYLRKICDIEKILSRLSYGTVQPASLLSLKDTLNLIPELQEKLVSCNSEMLKRIGHTLNPIHDLRQMLEDAIIDENTPATLKDGGVIKDGFSERVDKCRESVRSGHDWLAKLLEKEKRVSGIKNMKMGFNKVFGYYFEVSKSNLNLVPVYFKRKQTLTTGERYVTEELKSMEGEILNASDLLIELEQELFEVVCKKVENNIVLLQENAHALAILDSLMSFAKAAYSGGYVRPKITDDGIINIKSGRHPVVEKLMKGYFVPNDVYLDMSDNKLLIITGPNMAGKSTYMRQTGIITLMAHMGCFVPADSASICLVDRIFTRVGASDDLASGQSTFMVEMNELASILSCATENSLLILDEIGRGTSTYDGLSIAWATAEHIVNNTETGGKTLFATHYHELTELENMLPGVKNFSVSIKEKDNGIIFLHKIKKGSADRSFGIEVAKLAGIPSSVIDRAKELLSSLEKKDHIKLTEIADDVANSDDNSTPKYVSDLLKSIKNLNIDSMSPLEALTFLNDIKSRLSDYNG